MSSKGFTSSGDESKENRSFETLPLASVSEAWTFGEKMRVLRKLRELEFGALDRGADPADAILMVYRRALEFYDSQWPNDEGGFRDTLCKIQERRLRAVLKTRKVS